MTPSTLMYGLASFLAFLGLAAAQYGFSDPIPGVADFDPINDEIQGDIKNFAWLVNSTWQPTITGETLLDSDGHISLWITSFHGSGYTKCLAASVYSGSGGTWAWKIDLTDDEIDYYGGHFVYRLKPTVDSEDSPYDETEREVPSRGFRILKTVDAVPPSSSSSSTTTTTTTAPPTTLITSTTDTYGIETESDGATTTTTTLVANTVAPSPTSTASSTSSASPTGASGGYSTSDKIALGVGIGLGLPATLATLMMCCRGMR